MRSRERKSRPGGRRQAINKADAEQQILAADERILQRISNLSAEFHAGLHAELPIAILQRPEVLAHLAAMNVALKLPRPAPSLGSLAYLTQVAKEPEDQRELLLMLEMRFVWIAFLRRIRDAKSRAGSARSGEERRFHLGRIDRFRMAQAELEVLQDGLAERNPGALDAYAELRERAKTDTGLASLFGETEREING